MGGDTSLKPIVSKIYCSSSETKLMIRKRPHAVNGGGFVVTNPNQTVAFAVDGCGILGTKRELIVRDGDGASILFIRKREGFVEALTFNNKWKGYLTDYDGVPNKSVFSLRDPRSCLATHNVIKISIEPKEQYKDWKFEVRGSFLDKSCTINDCQGRVVAQVEVKEWMSSKDLYHVVVKQGYDQAFVIGIIAALDNIHGESTSC